jgi:hypothetical protein
MPNHSGLLTDPAYTYIQLIKLFIIANAQGPYVEPPGHYYDPVRRTIALLKQQEPIWCAPELYKSNVINTLTRALGEFSRGWTYELLAVVRHGTRLAQRYALDQYCSAAPTIRWQLGGPYLNPPKLISQEHYVDELLKMQAWAEYLECKLADYFMEVYDTATASDQS